METYCVSLSEQVSLVCKVGEREGIIEQEYGICVAMKQNFITNVSGHDMCL